MKYAWYAGAIMFGVLVIVIDFSRGAATAMPVLAVQLLCLVLARLS